MNARTSLLRICVWLSLAAIMLLQGCQYIGKPVANNDTLLTEHPADPASDPYPQNTPAPGRW